MLRKTNEKQKHVMNIFQGKLLVSKFNNYFLKLRLNKISNFCFTKIIFLYLSVTAELSK